MKPKTHGNTIRRTLQTLTAALLLALTLAAPSFAGGATNPPPPTVPTPEAAVALAAAGFGMGYAGDCAATRSPDDIGKACSKFVALSGNVRAYLLGRTFSEFNVWIFVRQSAAGWQLLGTLPFDRSMFSPTVPWPAQAVSAGNAGLAGAV